MRIVCRSRLCAATVAFLHVGRNLQAPIHASDKVYDLLLSTLVIPSRTGEQLQREGYTNVANVYGDIFEWVKTKHPVVTDDGAATDKIHGYSQFWGFWLK